MPMVEKSIEEAVLPRLRPSASGAEPVPDRHAFRPIGSVLASVLADIAMRSIHHHTRRANDTRLSPNIRTAALVQVERIAATALAAGILTEADHDRAD